MNFLRSALTVAAVLSAVPAQSTSYPNLVYATVPGSTPINLLLDLQVPVGTGPWPVVVWIHGGAWSAGSRLPIPGALTRLLPRGYAVASIDYRLSGTAIWPAQIHDCKAAIRFLRANAATWGLDPDRIGVMGSSAGGHLVAALATMGDVGTVRIGSFTVDLEGTVGAFTGTSSRVQAAVDQFGPTNMLHAHDFPTTFDHDAAGAPEALLIGGPLQQNPEKWASVDPINFLSPDDPPILAMHGTDDTTVPFHQSQMLLDAARAIGHDTALFAVQDNGHGGPGFSSPAANAAIDAFLDRTLRNLPAVVASVSAPDPVANENGDTATFQVTRSGPTTGPLVVRLWLGGEVTPGVDCDPLPLLCTIPAGQSSVQLTLVPHQDNLVEGDETAVLHIAPADRYRIDHAASSATATLVDDDPVAGLPVVTVLAVDASASEAGDPGLIRFVRTGPTALPLTVHYEVAGTATNGVDYLPLPGAVTIPANSNAADVVVRPIQDTEPESGETVILKLAADPNCVRGVDRSAHVVIADDDRSPAVPITGVLGTEPVLGEPGDGGVFTLTRTGPTTQPLTVHFAVSGTATSGLDFAPLGSIAVIPVGASWVRIPVTVLDDTLVEGAESITLSLVPDPAYRIGRAASQQLWIADDEAPAPPASSVLLAMTPLAVGNTGFATIAGGAPNGFVTVWIGLQPGWLPVPPFGVVQFDPGLAGPFASGLLDASGAATLPLAVPGSSSLAGLPCWWQAFATTAQAPFGAITAPQLRVLAGAPSF